MRALVIWASLLSLAVHAEPWTTEDTLAVLRRESERAKLVPPPPAGPMLMWSGVGFEPLPPEDIQMLLGLGFNQHLPLFGDHFATAETLAKAGAPIQLMQGLKAFPVYGADGKLSPFPANAEESFNLSRWHQVGELIRETLMAYQARGLSVDALWLDYEGYPFLAPYPKDRPSLADSITWAQERRQFVLNAASTYLAAPAREVFPSISVLNWGASLSYPESPLISATGQKSASIGPLFFTHTNPYAYGNTLAYEAAGLSPNLSATEVDQFYQLLLLRHVTTDALNRGNSAGYLGAIPWVARIVRDSNNQDLPIMSREAYRETLRHLWLRGAQSMLVFNSPYLNPQEHSAEIQDVSQIWRELSGYHRLIETGDVVNFNLPVTGEDGVMWSAVANSSQALVRVSPWGTHPPAIAQFQLWGEEFEVTLPEGSSKGSTYFIWRHPGTSIRPVMTAIPEANFDN